MPESPSPQPPALSAWLLDLFVPADQVESIPGDLLEEFSARASSSGPLAARRWYRRQVGRTACHLLSQQFRSAPLLILAAVVGALVLLHYSMSAVDLAVGVFLAHFEIYRYIPAGMVWVVYALGIDCVLCPLITGWLAAAVSKGRDMAVAISLGVIRTVPLIPLTIMIVWHRPAFARKFHLGHWFYAALLQVLLPAAFLFVGALIHRRRTTANRRRLAVG